jgi:L-alanine-DL-glutamate epimerase-like enolase superfamily enzyme
VELIRIAIPLVAPFRTSFGVQTDRDVLLIHLLGQAGEGWGECVAMGEPGYSSEYTEAAEQLIGQHLLPRLLARGRVTTAELGGVLASVRGHRMAKAALEMAWLDLELRVAGRSLAEYLGAVRTEVECWRRSPVTWTRGTAASSSGSSPASTSGGCGRCGSDSGPRCSSRSTPMRRTPWRTRSTSLCSTNSAWC